MKLQIILLFLVLMTQAILFPDFSESWTTQEKSDKLWEYINSFPYVGWSSPWLSPFRFLLFPLKIMRQSFEKTDFVQHYWYTLWLLPREKRIHTVGVAFRAEWVDQGGHSYTGLFDGGSDGATTGIVRLSLGMQNDAYNIEDSYGPYLPGAAFKFLRTGIHSANIHSMDGIDPYSETNFFMKPFNTHMKEVKQKLFPSKFAEASKYIWQVGLKDVALYKTNGNKVEKANYPFRLSFVPVDGLSTPSHKPTLFSPIPNFQDDLIEAIAADKPIFNVYAYETPESLQSQPTLIAKIFSRSNAVKSTFADEHLHFSHSDFQDDVDDHPEWANAVPTYETLFNIDWDETFEANEKYKSVPIVQAGKFGCPFL